MKIFKNKKGFTLIELMVVIAIIGLLLGLIIASISKNKIRARDNARVTQIQQAQLGLEEYKAANGKYPTVFSASSLAQTGAKYLPSDFPFSQFKYVPFKSTNTSNTCTDYHLGIVMEDGEPVLSDCKVDRDDFVTVGVSPQTRMICGQSKPVYAPYQCWTASEFNGASSNCTSGGAGPDLCLDVTSKLSL